MDPLTVEDLTTELQKLYMTMYPKKDEDDEEDDEEEDEEEEQSEKALAAYNSGQVKKKCFRCGQWVTFPGCVRRSERPVEETSTGKVGTLRDLGDL